MNDASRLQRYGEKHITTSSNGPIYNLLQVKSTTPIKVPVERQDLTRTKQVEIAPSKVDVVMGWDAARAHASLQRAKENRNSQERHALYRKVMEYSLTYMKYLMANTTTYEDRLKTQILSTLCVDWPKQEKILFSTKYQPHFNLKPVSNDAPVATVSVLNQDSLNVARLLIDQGYRPMVLNMANPIIIGGGYQRGDSAQEESLFRSTNLSDILDATPNRVHVSAIAQKMYPLTDGKVLMTPMVDILRDSSDRGWSFLDKIHSVAVVSAAAPDLRMYRGSIVDATLIQRWIRNVIYLLETCAAYAGQENLQDTLLQPVDSLVLGAWGCGVFGNDPRLVASLFWMALHDNLTTHPRHYLRRFKHIAFAVLSDNAQDAKSNFATFYNIFDETNIDPERLFLSNMDISKLLVDMP